MAKITHEAIDIDTQSAPQRQGRQFEPLIGAVAGCLGRIGFTPNALSCASVLPAAGAIYAVATGAFMLALVLMALSGLCDLLDGPLARRSNQISRFGALLDSTLDRFADAAPLIGLSVFYSGYGWVCLIPAGTLFAAYTVSYVRARAEGLEIDLPPMWMRRTTRMVAIGVALLLAPIAIDGVSIPAPLTLAGIALLGLLSLAASVHALIVAARLLTPRERGAN